MKIINLDNLVTTDLTVDSTEITVDSTRITVDTTYTVGNSVFLLITPREYVDEVIITLYNELTQQTYTDQTLTEISGNYLKIFFNTHTFNEGENYELVVRSLDNKVIYKSKCYVTMQDDLQNFKLISPSPSKKIEF